MIIDKISVINWMGHKTKELDLAAGRNLIFGRNASGKSSLAKAIAFTFTGTLPKNIDPRRLSKSEAIVSLTITANDSNKYLIRRQINSAKKLSNSLFIYDVKNPSDALYTGDRAEDFLHELAGLSSDIFERVIYMKEEDVYEFLSKPDSGVMREIDRLIGLEKAHQLSREVENITSEHKTILKTIEKDRKGIEEAVKRELGITQSTIELKKARKRLEEIPVITQELIELQDHYEEQQKLLEELGEIKNSITAGDFKQIESKIIELQLSFEHSRGAAEKIIKDNNQKLEQLQHDQGTIEAKSDLKVRIIKDLEGSETTECPTCGRKMDKELINNVLKKLKTELKGLSEEVNSQIAKISTLKEENEKKGLVVTDLVGKITSMQNLKLSVGQYFTDLNIAEEGIKQLQKKGYPKSQAEIEKKLDELDKENRELNQAIGRAEGAEQTTSTMVEKKKQDEEDLKHKLKIMELIEKAIEQTTKKLRDTYSAEVKNQAEAIWSAYKGEKWLIEWDDNFVPKAKPANAERELTAYEMSGSERFLILLAIRLAIQKSLEQFNLLIIDEPCQHLDEANGRAFRDILTTIAEDKIKQSIIFTYNEDFLEGDWSKVHKLS